MSAPLFDTARKKHLAAHHRSPSATANDLYNHYMNGLAERLLDIKQTFQRTLVITDTSVPATLDTLTNTQKISKTHITRAHFDSNDMLTITPGAYDLVVVMGVLHTANDLQKMVLQLRFALAPGGCMIAVFPGEDTLHELRETLARAEVAVSGGLSPRVHPTMDARSFAALMQSVGFQGPVVDTDRTILEYKNLDQLFVDLRSVAATNIQTARPRTLTKRSVFDTARSQYPETIDGLHPATITLIYAIGWVSE